MALYIAPDNQRILWEMIQGVPAFLYAFPLNTPMEMKTNWFKEHIQAIYNRIPSNITREQLKQYNRDTLSEMIQSLQQSKQSIPVDKSVFDMAMTTTTIDRSAYSRLQNENKKNTNIEQVETQYRSLFEIPKPQPPDFSEKIEDEVITNMSELIDQHRKIREQELQAFGPPPIVAESKTSLDIEPKEPIQHQIEKKGELSEINKRLDSLEKKMDESIELFKKFFQELSNKMPDNNS